MVYPECEIASQCAQEYVIDLDELHAELRNQMSSAQKRYQVPVDHYRLPAPNFCIGQKVFVSAEHIRTTRPAKKLSEEYLGPYEIIAKPGTHLYECGRGVLRYLTRVNTSSVYSSCI